MGIASLHGSPHQYLLEVASGLSAYADRQNLMRETWGHMFLDVVGLGLVVAGLLVSPEYTETLIWHQITFRGQPL